MNQFLAYGLLFRYLVASDHGLLFEGHRLAQKWQLPKKRSR